MLDRNELMAQRVAELLSEEFNPTRERIARINLGKPRLVCTRKEVVEQQPCEVKVFSAGGLRLKQEMRVRKAVRNNTVAEQFLKRAASKGL